MFSCAFGMWKSIVEDIFLQVRIRRRMTNGKRIIVWCRCSNWSNVGEWRKYETYASSRWRSIGKFIWWRTNQFSRSIGRENWSHSSSNVYFVRSFFDFPRSTSFVICLVSADFVHTILNIPLSLFWLFCLHYAMEADFIRLQLIQSIFGWHRTLVHDRKKRILTRNLGEYGCFSMGLIDCRYFTHFYRITHLILVPKKQDTVVLP